MRDGDQPKRFGCAGTSMIIHLECDDGTAPAMAETHRHGPGWTKHAEMPIKATHLVCLLIYVVIVAVVIPVGPDRGLVEVAPVVERREPWGKADVT